jgi:hypothetical protein
MLRPATRSARGITIESRLFVEAHFRAAGFDFPIVQRKRTKPCPAKAGLYKKL